MKPALSMLMLLIAIVHGAATADQIEPFIGEYAGETISNDDELDKRDLGVTIERKDNGFTVRWTTITTKPDGRAKKKSYAIDFLPTPRGGIYSSAMKTNVFGGAEPLDPLKGDPYVWARVAGDTLSVFALIITDEGGYEMQVYDRTRTADGLQLEFSRIRDGETLKLIKGSLSRKK
ncbi:MAG: hypothetical protein ACR2RB_12145 [Gammaproteobacteria bacterium]